MKRYNEREKQRIAASVVCALCAVTVSAGTMGCMPEDQISEPPPSVGTSSANAGTGATTGRQTVTTKKRTADTTSPQIEDTEPWFEDLPAYVIESGIVWYGGGYTFGDQASWMGKYLVDPFYWAIKETELNEEKLKYAVSVDLYADDQYQYNGKTLAEYEADAYKERMAPAILGELLKVGDQLKYGELLYTTGTPNHTPGAMDFELWSKELYDQTVEYFGEELLAKYIVDGEFLRDKVEADMEAPVPTVAKEAYIEAQKAYKIEKFRSMQEYLTGLGIENAVFAPENSDYAHVYMIFFVTREQFAGLSCADLGIADAMKLSFSLAAKAAYNSESVGDG